MSDKKSPPSFIKSISDTILLSAKLSFSDTSQIHPYEQIGQKELGQQPTRNKHFTSLIQIGGSLTIFASVLIIVLTTWLANEKISYTKVYRGTIVSEFDGWGTSLAWWAEFIGSLDEQRRKEFISRVFHPSNEDSLQFNIIRFNMGGAPEILPNGTTVDVDFSPFKGIPSLELSNRTYDWNADTFQLSVVQDILLLNNTSMIIEAFSNSPPWWMTKSKNSMGNFDGSDNLDLVNYTIFADYIASVIDHAINVWNIPIQYVEPFNEPDENFWRVRPNSQEGNHWDQSSMRTFLPILSDSIKSKKLNDRVMLSITDSYSIRAAMSSLDTFTDFIYKANVHGYGRFWNLQVSEMDDLIQRVRKRNNIRKVWMSESGGYGLGDQGVVDFAFDIINHINILEAEAWIYWQVLDQTSSWALIVISERYPWWFSQYNYNPYNTMNFYTMQQFSNHIKPGYSILKTSQSIFKDDCSPVCVLTASSSIDGVLNKIVVVLLNNSPKSYDHKIDLSEVMNLNNQTIIDCFRTAEWNGNQHTRIENCARIRPNNAIKVLLFGLSVTTIEVY